MPCQSPYSEEKYDPSVQIIDQNRKIIEELDNVTDFLCFTLKYLCEKDYPIVKEIFKEKQHLRTWFDNHLFLDNERKLIEESKKFNEMMQNKKKDNIKPEQEETSLF
jgi:predicted MPP superfamily phosphohydrolase